MKQFRALLSDTNSSMNQSVNDSIFSDKKKIQSGILKNI